MTIDRRACVGRHDVVVRGFDPEATFTIGNGDFACTVDATGLQTFPDLHPDTRGGGLHILSSWGWHSSPNPAGYRVADYPTTAYDHHGRAVAYARLQPELAHHGHAWLRGNPHRLGLGRIGFVLRRADGALLGAEHVSDVDARLELWSGRVVSRFRVAGVAVAVETACDPARDVLAVRVRSPLLRDGRLAIALAFPYGSGDGPTEDWTRAGDHRTALTAHGRGARIARELDATRFHVDLAWTGDAAARQAAAHVVVVEPRGGEALDLVVGFAPDGFAALPGADAVHADAAAHWRAFWSGGAAVEFAGSADARAGELERRVVLSQYLTAVQCASRLPPQETGLTCNSWMGKFHLEMHWWHAAHFALWGRTALLARSLDWYAAILPRARELARAQGYAGARWPKCVAEDGVNAPCTIEPWLLWQQPHPIALCELVWRAEPTRATLERYAEVVLGSAEFMADFAWRGPDGRYHLGPPAIPVQENHAPEETVDPPCELAQWWHGLAVAARWRQRLGLPPEPRWDGVRAALAPLPVDDGVYVAHAGCDAACTYQQRNFDHPAMLGALGFVPRTPLVDDATMRRTLQRSLERWRWDDVWGWDFPLAALTATALGDAATAYDALLKPTAKNRYLANGHNWQADWLPCYLPGNGGVLAAVAALARARCDAPGWRLAHEGFGPDPRDDDA